MIAARAARFTIAIASIVAVAACGDLTGSAGEPVASPEVPLASAHEATTITFGDFALHVPANVHQVRGILLALGGPNTQGFAAGTPFGAPPFLEPLLQDLGVRFRDLAAERGLAILGSSRFAQSAFPNSPASDQAILAAIAEAASLTGRDELAGAPILIYGISGGGPEAIGFTQRNPERVQGVFLKVPAPAGPLTGDALHVPGHMVLAENDVLVPNPVLQGIFTAHRAVGAPWGISIEPGVGHLSLSEAQRDLTIDWMRAILPLGNAGPFRGTSPQVGFLGDPATGEIAPVRAFAGNPSAASWFPTRPLAVQWAAFTGS